MVIEPALPHNYHSDRKKVMELCDLYLAQDSTMLSSTENSTTIKRCLKAASSILLKLKQLDPLLDTQGLDAQCIKEVLS